MTSMGRSFWRLTRVELRPIGPNSGRRVLSFIRNVSVRTIPSNGS